MNEVEITERITMMRAYVENLNHFLESIGEWGHAEVAKEVIDGMNEIIQGLRQKAREGL